MKNLVLLFFLALTHLAFCQTSYNTSYHQNSGNPGGLNTEVDLDPLLWTNIGWHMMSGNQWTNATTIPFPFEFYGDPVTSFQASHNGVITFSNPGAAPGNNVDLPSSQLPDLSICAFWDSYHAYIYSGWINTKVFGVLPNRQFWINYSDFPIGGATGAIFSIVLEETSNKIYIVDQYANGFTTGTVGLQKNLTTYAQYGSNTEAIGSATTQNSDNSYYEFNPVTTTNVEEASTTAFTLYPNPANHSVTLELDLPEMNAITIELLSIDGKVLQRVDRSSVQSAIVKLDVSLYSKGVYLVRMNDGTSQVTKKLVLAR